jgi:uncharacterized Zn-binding protein involved in type VI secretion
VVLRGLLGVCLAFAGVACFMAAADAQNPPPRGGSLIIQGSPDVLVGGVSAARQGDIMKKGVPITRGSPNVFINGKPAALMGNGIACSSNVFVNGKPLARIAANTKGCAKR